MGGQLGDVGAALAQRRQLQGDHRQPVVEVFAQGTLLHRPSRSSIGRRDHPDVDRMHLVATHRPHYAVLEKAQQLHLQVDVHLGDLVQEQHAAVRLAQQSQALAVGSGERPLDVSEQLALEQARGDRGDVDRDERAAAARAVLVQGARQQLLAGATGSDDQHRKVAGHHLVRQVQAPHQGRRAADDLGVGVLETVARQVFLEVRELLGLDRHPLLELAVALGHRQPVRPVLLEQAVQVQGDRRLVGEGLQPRQVRLFESAALEAVVDVDATDQLVARQQRGAQHRAQPHVGDALAGAEVALLGVLAEHRRALLETALENRRRQLALRMAHRLAIQAAGRGDTPLALAAAQHHEPALGAEQRHRLVEQQIEQGLPVLDPRQRAIQLENRRQAQPVGVAIRATQAPQQLGEPAGDHRADSQA